jgi:hypothetical protein
VKKFLCFFGLTGILTVLLSLEALAVSWSVDTSNTADGYVTVTAEDFKGKTIRIYVGKGSEIYYYEVNSVKTNIPLQMGTGEYAFKLLEDIGGGKSKVVAAETVHALAIDEQKLYTVSHPFVDYDASTTAIPAYKALTENQSGTDEKVNVIYEEVVTSYAYNNDLAAEISSGKVSSYIPVIDHVYAAKKGICYDFASLFGGTLRSQGIPARLVMGYPPEKPGVYHAWNEIFIDNQWLAVDTTFDSAIAAAGQTYVMVRDRSEAAVVKVY